VKAVEKKMEGSASKQESNRISKTTVKGRGGESAKKYREKKETPCNGAYRGSPGIPWLLKEEWGPPESATIKGAGNEMAENNVTTMHEGVSQDAKQEGKNVRGPTKN